MASPGHRANILEPRFRDIGLAFVEAPGTESGVLWVQEFGQPVADWPSQSGLGKPAPRVTLPSRLRQPRMARVAASGG
jgi:hypothetical protein